LRMAVALSSNDPVNKIKMQSCRRVRAKLGWQHRYYDIKKKFSITAQFKILGDQRKKVPKCCNWLAWALLNLEFCIISENDVANTDLSEMFAICVSHMRILYTGVVDDE
ncbi:hypothetical protein T01_13472, partial [Trichinella spiralis]